MKDDRAYLQHIGDSIERILEYTAKGEPTFLSDKKTQDAVIRNFEVIGEAVKQLSDNLKSEHPDIPWRQIAGMRDKMIHEYFGVNLQLVWEVVQGELPPLRAKIQSMLQSAS